MTAVCKLVWMLAQAIVMLSPAFHGICSAEASVTCSGWDECGVKACMLTNRTSTAEVEDKNEAEDEMQHSGVEATTSSGRNTTLYISNLGRTHAIAAIDHEA